ncbi:MAG: cupin domain-containing protein [Actinomycetota bacterium]
MRRITLIMVAAGLFAGMVAGLAVATPGSGVTSTVLAQGTLKDVDVRTKTGAWKAQITTKGTSDLIVRENRVAPGGHFGWHSHPGPSLVIVKSGTSTFYRGDDPTCTPQVHAAGTAYVDPGGTVHIARNESETEELVLIVTSLIPQGAMGRIDEADPGTCPF